MGVAAVRSSQKALAHLADRVLEAPDLSALTRLLTEDLPRALGSTDATLLLWDRRLETFEGVALTQGRHLRTFRPQPTATRAPQARWLLSEGHLLETHEAEGKGVLVPLLARSGLSGMLVLGRRPGRRRPLSAREAGLVSLIAARAALALENHAYQKELIASERLAALGTMAGMLAHDFRGPMTVIRGYAETLHSDSLPAEEVAARARLIVDAVDRLERMTDETLDFARGAERLVLRAVSLGVLLAELAAGIEEEVPGLVLVRDFDLGAAGPYAVDVDKLRRALSNVAVNAAEAMGGRGKLRFSARLERGAGDAGADVLVLVLADEGPGVDPAVRDRLFEPFAAFGQKRGTGLGLAVARRFVEDHGGALDLLAAEGPPGGARFRVTLPLSAAAGVGRAG